MSMECTWDEALLQRGDQLPPELLEIIRTGGDNEYLDSITKAALDCRYTYTLFAHCERIWAHVCSRLRHHGSFETSIATLGRIVPFAPYLSKYAEKLLAAERHHSGVEGDSNIEIVYLLGLFRLLNHDRLAFQKYIDSAQISSFLRSTCRPVVYLAIRILQVCLHGSDHWFETMIKIHLGADSADDAIEGLWDQIIIDYRFLTLWEQERHERVQKLLQDAASSSPRSKTPRTLPPECFDSSVAIVGGICMPRASISQQTPVSRNFVETETVSENLKNVATALKSPKPLLLTGLAGAGKSMLARHAANELGQLDRMVTLHLNEQTDAKLLIGVYTTGQTPGSFIWKPGVLTTAVQEGRWVLIEDLDRAPNEVIGTLLPLIEKGQLLIPNRKQKVYASPGFRVIATVRTSLNHRGNETNTLAHMLGARLWQNVHIDVASMPEQRLIANKLFPALQALLPQFMAVYSRLEAFRLGPATGSRGHTGLLRPISLRDLLKWCNRVVGLLRGKETFTSGDMDDIYLEATDCFLGALPSGAFRLQLAAIVAEELRIDPQRRDYLLSERDIEYRVDKDSISLGRYSLACNSQAKKAGAKDYSFSTNPHTSRMLERVAAAATNREPLLLVGETGVGKTTAVQHLARNLGKKLVPFNLSQQSEAGDLLGGFKPVNARSLIVPMKDEFDDLFTASFSMSKNQEFLELLGKQMAKGNWKSVCKLWQRALKMVDQQRSESAAAKGEAPSKKRKVETKRTVDVERWDIFSARVIDIEKRLATGSEAFAFSFVEGTIVKAIRNGDWILLDEINLASMDTLESIADLLDPTSPSILLTESGSVERIDAHPEFRLFAAMNPATDVGKKDLPPGIRSRFTELYVESPDKDIRSLQSIVRSYLRHETATDQSVLVDVSTLYQKIIALGEQNKLVDGAGQKPHFSLRTLTRTLSYAKYIAPLCNLRRALYEGFQMSFLTFLDAESSRIVQPLLEQHLFGKRTNIRAELQKALRKPSDGHQYVQGWPGSRHWVRRGNLDLEDQPQYILTPFIRSNIENLVRATSTRQFPVLIQGPTSSGKTSMIEYLARRTGHKFVRINNHEHTDLQEYLGTYISGIDGKLQFQEGILVKALREGHWIVLDELNLAPTDVLEALNRLLDDNRELLIPETQEVVRPHENFMLFATQNPAGLYGGRKTLSRAFRNRFLELHFDDIPIDELQEILHRRTQLPESRCKRIVAVYRELSVLRQESRLFEQKSFATLRDLFRWALRPNDTIEQLASNGFMLLAERVRKAEERQILKEIIEKAMSANGPRVRIDEPTMYARDCPELSQYQQSARSDSIVWTKAMRRLYVLVSRAIANNEPVLLVGETGCGKTTVCQMLADALGKELHTVNAHQNTETGDLIGSQRPIRNRAMLENTLHQKLLASPFLQGLPHPDEQSVDTLSSAYDQAVSYLEKGLQAAHSQSPKHLEILSLRTRSKALFEWADGSLVQAMKRGAFFLLDEISLADDSVLERINSVLEPQRSVLLAEKGSLDSFVTAASGFQFFATMNPGGDYGKRELSPALRNRFTEIWVPSLNDADDVTQIVTAKLADGAKQFANSIVRFAQWFKRQYNMSASSSISIRDALAWVNFVNAAEPGDVQAAVVHGAAMVYIDTLGANPAGLMTMMRYSLDEERQACLIELGRLLRVDAGAIYAASVQVSSDLERFRTGYFSVSKKQDAVAQDVGFSFDPPTTKTNAMRVVRALQLSKPVMLEGNPGVGKTALVTAIADAVGVPLVRINLSEQTDLIDLFGSDIPIEGAATGSFTWRDAPFLRAMKNGDWVLLDEMNLASQSVLEGLNACLDHRGEVFVPELGQTFIRHPDFRLFAAQNPHHQGGGRKGLPASFVNRFTVVYADAFRSEDLMLICRRRFPSVDKKLVTQAVDFVERLEHEVTNGKRIGSSGGPWEFNLRDVSRWLALASADLGLLEAGSARDFVEFLFAQRFRSAADRRSVAEIFDKVFTGEHARADLFQNVSPQALQLGLGLLPRNAEAATFTHSCANIPNDARHSRVLESLMLCVQQDWPVILTGPTGVGKTALIERLAAAVGAPLVTIAMNTETDAMDLVGGYEQFDPQRRTYQTIRELHECLSAGIRRRLASKDGTDLIEALDLLQKSEILLSSERANPSSLIAALEASGSEDFKTWAQRLRTTTQAIDRARFEWIDGLLVDALRDGKWLVLDNANLCSSSVLDRLNSLLEPNGSLIINEHSDDDGAARVLRPHPSFRIFLTLDPRYGELSRAMRNRAVELYLSKDALTSAQTGLDPLFAESAVARLRIFKPAAACFTEPSGQDFTLAIHDHLSLFDQPLLARLRAQLDHGLYGNAGSATIMPRELQAELAQQQQGFHIAMISQLQGPADFASVQTLHPLNNQPLVCTSQHALTQASSLAVLFDLRVNLVFMQQILQALQSDPSRMKRLRQIEQSWTRRNGQASTKSKDSQVVTLLGQVVAIFSDFARDSAIIPREALQTVKLLFNGLCTIWKALHDYCVHGNIDQATVTALLNTARKSVRSIGPPNSEALDAVLPQFLSTFDGLLSTEHDTRGLACTPLWTALRPSTPSTLDQLKALLDFEALVNRFDELAACSQISLDEAAELRVQLAQAMKIARRGGQDLEGLTQTLHSLGLAANEKRVEESTRPFCFLPVFQRIEERFMSVKDVDCLMSKPDSAKLEILAQRSTTQSRLSMDSARGFILPSHQERAPGSVHHDEKQSRLFQRIDNASQTPLSDLESLTVEAKLLGRILSSQAHVLGSSELDSLDRCLDGLLAELLVALQKSDDGNIRSLAIAVDASGAAERADTTTDDRLEWANLALRGVARHVRASYSDRSTRMISAAAAWTSLALVTLHLYIPGSAFDPALEPLLQLKVHRTQLQDLSKKRHALRTFRAMTTSEPESMRARMIEEDIEALGSEPEVASVCRPEASELSKLQAEFDTLVRILEPFEKDVRLRKAPRILDSTARANVGRTRSRLQNQYRAYDDLTEPVVLFIDALCIGDDLAAQAQDLAIGVSPLDETIPFVEASAQTWLRDDAFVKTAASISRLDHELQWLNAVALRCQVRPLQHCSNDLRARVGETFQKFHAAWRDELSEDQKKNAAKSSLYKFKGTEEDQNEPSQEDLDELFPCGQFEGDRAGSSIRKSMQDRAQEIARLHASVHGGQLAEDRIAMDLLREWLSNSTSDPLMDRNSHLIPAVIFALGELTDSLPASAAADRQYNMYTDSNLAESWRLHHLLRKVESRFQELQYAWPEHATPGDVLVLCSQVFAMAYTSPLPRFFPLLEKLHATVNEWQKVASREYSAANILDDLTNTIISWRQLELSAWAGVFNREWQQCEKTASSWWFVAYESIIATTETTDTPDGWTSRHAEDLLKTLSGFMSVSGLGEYSARLRLLRNFSAELAFNKNSNKAKGLLHDAVQNFIAFYAHFEMPVSEALTKGRVDLEKEAKNIIQIASWKDRNIDTLRQSAQSSHRKLLRLVKKYRNLLAQPVSTILQGEIPAKVLDDLSTMALPVVSIRSDDKKPAIELSGIAVWENRADRFRNAVQTAELLESKISLTMRSFDGQEQLQSFTLQLEKDIVSLQKATPLLLTEENKTLVSHLKTRKRRLFADVLKEARGMGFQTSMSVQALSSQSSTDQVLSGLPSMILETKRCNTTVNTSALHRILDVMTTVRESARGHSDDLTPAEVSRSSSLLESMLQQCISQYKELQEHAFACSELQLVIQRFVNFADYEAQQTQNTPRIEDIRESLSSLAIVLPVCIQTLQHQMNMAGPHITPWINTFRDLEARAQQRNAQFSSLPQLPLNIETQAHAAIRHEWSQLQQEISTVAQDMPAQHPETGPIVAQLSRWIMSNDQRPEQSLMNGHTGTDKFSWIAQMLNIVDIALAAVQNVEKVHRPTHTDSAWVIDEQKAVNRTIHSLRIPQITAGLGDLLSKVYYLERSGEADLAETSAVCQSVLPIISAYAHSVSRFVVLQSSSHAQLATTAYKLATTLKTLCQRGFCTPSDKSEENDSSEGNVESGTGLGDGEGAEDISKDIAPDEDLSELAQEAKREQQSGEEMEDQKDAVDMADEDMEGELGDAPDAGDNEDGDASGDEADENGDMDEESGEVDDNGPSAIDEKMWDSGKDESQREKESDEAKGQANENDTAAGKRESEAQEGQDEELDGDEKDAEAGAESEEVRKETAEQMDPHTRDEENLDLPEDMTMDQKKGEESGGSDIESTTSDHEAMSENGQDADMDEWDDEEKDEGGENRKDDAEKTDAGEEDADDDAGSDMLMEDEKPQDSNMDPQSNAVVPPEGGSGPDQAEDREQNDGQGMATGGESAEQQNEEEEAEDPEAKGAAASGETTQGGDDANQEETLPFKRIGDALHEWYKQNADIQQARQPQQPQDARKQPEQPTSTQFEHLPDEDVEADAQALGTASAEQSMALDEDQAMSVNEDEQPEQLPFQDGTEHNDEQQEGDSRPEPAQLEPSDSLRQQSQSNAFVGEPTNGDVEMADDPATSEEDEVDDVDQQLLETHISNDANDPGEVSLDLARQAWTIHEESTRNLSLLLTEHLRLILQPTQATKMRGDFRTGKRLNIKRIIPYIASSYKRDKIWMRRSVPSKRAYQVMLAIDDSKSMLESDSRHLAFETLAMVTRSLSMLEVGEMSVVGFGEEVKIAHDFGLPFTSEAGAEIFKRLTFAQNRTDVRKLLQESIELFRAARLKASGSASDLWQLQLIVSDGICEDHPSIRQLVRQAHEERIMIVFIVIDAGANQQQPQASESSSAKQSILDLQSAEFGKDEKGEMQLKMVKYLDTFPFRYYLIVRDVQELPGVLAGALRQWFAEVIETAG